MAMTSYGNARDENHRQWMIQKERERPQREKIGQEFKQARERAGFSVNAMARMTGLAWKTVQKFEDGEYVMRPKLIQATLWNALKLKEVDIVRNHLGSIKDILCRDNALQKVSAQIIQFPKRSEAPRLKGPALRTRSANPII